METDSAKAARSPAEIAARWGISKRTVNRYIRDGLLPAYRVGRLVRVDPDDLDRFIEPVAPRRGGGTP